MKLGPHVIRSTPKALDWVRRAPFVASLDNVEALRAARPEVPRLFRHFFKEQKLDADPADVANAILDALGGYRHERLYAQIYVGIPKELTPEYIRLCQGVVPLLAAAGVKAAGPGWYSGSYEREHWQAFRESIVELHDGTILTWCGFQRIVVQGYWYWAIGPTKYNAYRYRDFWQPGDPLIFKGECGEDEVRDGDKNINGGMVGRPGYKANGRTTEQHRAGLVVYAAGVEQDPMVEGVAAFTAGPTPDWIDFDEDAVDTSGFDYDGRAFGPAVHAGGTPVIEKTPPTGFGWWIWYADKALGKRTPAQFADVCLSRRISHVFIKAGDGPNVWEQFAKVVEPLKAAGLRVYSWSYCYGDPDGWGAEADVALAALAAGSDGHVFDVEGECEGKGGSVVRTLEAVRERYSNAWLATAPLPVIDLHEPSLYEASARYVDAFLPQFYWRELGREGYGDLDNLFARWKRWTDAWRVDGHTVPAIMPVGQAYGDATLDEIVTFVKRARAEGCPAVSFWEWSASTDEQWQTVANQAVESVPAKPEPIPEPPAGPEPGVSWEQVALYGQWATARVANREDPRDGDAFAAHVRAIGGEAMNLGRYGWPG